MEEMAMNCLEYQYIKILNVCVCLCVCLCVTEVGSSGDRTTVVTYNLHNYTLYCVCVITSMQTHVRSSSWRGHSWGTVSEADAVGEQQLKQMQLGWSSAWPHETTACQRHYHTRLLVRQGRRLCQSHADMMEVRPQKHTWRESCRAACCAITNGRRAPFAPWRAARGGCSCRQTKGSSWSERSYLYICEWSYLYICGSIVTTHCIAVWWSMWCWPQKLLTWLLYGNCSMVTQHILIQFSTSCSVQGSLIQLAILEAS